GAESLCGDRRRYRHHLRLIALSMLLRNLSHQLDAAGSQVDKQQAQHDAIILGKDGFRCGRHADTARTTTRSEIQRMLATKMEADFDKLLENVKKCRVCSPHLPLGPRPVLRGRPAARLLIISQAPGKRVHETGLSFNDRSGDRLREWLALDRETFY